MDLLLVGVLAATLAVLVLSLAAALLINESHCFCEDLVFQEAAIIRRDQSARIAKAHALGLVLEPI